LDIEPVGELLEGTQRTAFVVGDGLDDILDACMYIPPFQDSKWCR